MSSTIGAAPAAEPRSSSARVRARRSLEALSLGDAFGERVMRSPAMLHLLGARQLPPPPWEWTDDTQMALSIVACLEEHGRIEPHRLALAFADRFEEHRGYGGGALRWVQAVRGGVPWFEAARALFRGEGSYGNGGAMRAAPLGAWFAGDPETAKVEARASAAVTHAHPEGQAGAEAVALAASLLASPQTAEGLSGAALLDAVVRRLDGETATREGLRRARDLGPVEPARAAAVLGSGADVSSQDTVPFALWCAAHHLGDFRAAMWAAASGLGDMDTVCAITAGVLGAASAELPTDWLACREPLPRW